jgi:hypothetical protein
VKEQVGMPVATTGNDFPKVGEVMALPKILFKHQHQMDDARMSTTQV